MQLVSNPQQENQSLLYYIHFNISKYHISKIAAVCSKPKISTQANLNGKKNIEKIPNYKKKNLRTFVKISDNIPIFQCNG